MIRHLFISAAKYLLAQQTATFGNKDGLLGALTDMGCLKLQTVLINWDTELDLQFRKYARKIECLSESRALGNEADCFKDAKLMIRIRYRC